MDSATFAEQIRAVSTKIQILSQVIILLRHATPLQNIPPLDQIAACPVVAGLHQIELLVLESRHLYSTAVASQIRVYGTSQPVTAHDRILDAAGGLAYSAKLFRERCQKAIDSDNPQGIRSAWANLKETVSRISRDVESVTTSELATERDRAIAAIPQQQPDALPPPPTPEETVEKQSIPDKLAGQFTSPFQQIIVKYLAERMGRLVEWSNLPKEAFRREEDRNPEAELQALKRVRKTLNEKCEYQLRISRTNQTAQLMKLDQQDN